jgi:hypothetical protein
MATLEAVLYLTDLDLHGYGPLARDAGCNVPVLLGMASLLAKMATASKAGSQLDFGNWFLMHVKCIHDLCTLPLDISSYLHHILVIFMLFDDYWE